MFNSLTGILGNISVEETRDNIIVNGINAKLLISDIERGWRTTKFTNNVIKKYSYRQMVFGKFFAIDILYCVDGLLSGKLGIRPYSPKRALLRLKALLLSETWLRTLSVPNPLDHDMKALDKIVFKMLPHQMDFIESYLDIVPRYNLNGMLLSAAAGTGKTMINIGLSMVLRSTLTIYVVPKNSVESVWAYSLQNYVKKPEPFWTSAKDGPAPLGLSTYVFHYEALDRALDLVARMGPAFISRQTVYLGLDESHNFNERGSNRTQRFIDLGNALKAKHRVWSSGTPVKALGVEMVPLLRSIDPMFDDDTEMRFTKIFGRSASRALDILSNRIGLVSFRVVKEEIVTNKVTEIVVNVTTPDSHLYTLEYISKEMANYITKQLEYYNSRMPHYVERYEYLVDKFSASASTSELQDLHTYRTYIAAIRKRYDAATMKHEVQFCNNYELKHISVRLPKEERDEFRSIRSIIKYVDLKVMGEALGKILGKARAECYTSLVAHIDFRGIIDGADAKTVIFTSYVDTCNEVYKTVADMGYEPALIHGSSGNSLPKTVEAFMTKDEINPLVTTFQSMSTAVPLIAANTEIFINQPFRDHERVQAIARVNRLGQEKDVFIYDALLDTGDKPNISTRSKDILQWSREQVALIMGVKVDDDTMASIESMDNGQRTMVAALSCLVDDSYLDYV